MISTIEKVLFLKKVDLFQGLPAEELAHIAQIAEQLDFGSGHTIFNEGDRGDAMYMIVNGKVRVHAHNQTLAELQAGQCFGEMSLLDDSPRSATVTTVTELNLLKISRDDFVEILAEAPDISLGIIKVLTRRLRDMNRR